MLIADNNKRRTKKIVHFFATKARLAVAHRIERKCALDIRIVVENSKRNESNRKATKRIVLGIRTCIITIYA